MNQIRNPSLKPRVLLAAALVAAAGAAHSQADPTKPAAAYLAAQAKASGQKEAEPEAGGPANAQILVSSGARRFAMVDGHVVRPGETYNGAKLVAINEHGAVWDRGGNRESPSMTPAVQKTSVAAAAAEKPAAPASKKHKEPK